MNTVDAIKQTNVDCIQASHNIQATQSLRGKSCSEYSFIGRWRNACLLHRAKGMQACGQAQNGEEALRLFRLMLPDVTLMDLHMPEMNGILATSHICQEFPAACIVTFTAFAEKEVASILQAGAKAYILKDAPLADLLSAIRAASPQA